MTGNYEIIQKIVKFRSIRKMGALHVNYLQKKIQNDFGWIYDTYGYMYIWIYDTYGYMIHMDICIYGYMIHCTF